MKICIIYSFKPELCIENTFLKREKEICNYLDPASVTWFINSYDSDNNPEFRDKIEAYGFKVKVAGGW